jgi:hypothetical protein
MRLSRFSLLFSLALLLAALVSFTFVSGLQAQSSREAGANTEDERVEFRAAVPPVPLRLQAGATFQEANLPLQNTGKGWYRIPSWFAGYWHREALIERKFGYPDRRQVSQRDMRRGYQVDRRGDIWHPRNEPFTVRVDRGDSYDLNNTLEMKPLKVSDNEVVLEIHAMGIRVSKADGRIISNIQKREVHTFRPGKPGRTIEAESTGMGYDQQGRSLLDKPFRKFYSEFLKAPFKLIRNEDGRDYYSDFCDYLRATNQDDLLPAK